MTKGMFSKETFNFNHMGDTLVYNGFEAKEYLQNTLAEIDIRN